MLPHMLAILILGNKTGKGKGNVIRNSPPGGFKMVITHTHLGNGTVSVSGFSGVKYTALPSMLSSLGVFSIHHSGPGSHRMPYEMFLGLPELAESRGGLFLLFSGYFLKKNVFD